MHETRGRSSSNEKSRFLTAKAVRNDKTLGLGINARTKPEPRHLPLLQTFTFLSHNLRIKFSMRFQLSGVFLLLVAALLFSQQSPDSQPKLQVHDQQTPPIAVDVRVVNVLATVRDKHGKIVSNLTQDNFTLEEDTHPVTIRYFAKETDLPLTLGLLVDTSMSQRRVLDQERAASKTFLDQVLREKDTAFLIHFDKEVELLQDSTSSRPKLEAALESLRTPAPTQEDNSPDSGGGSGGNWPGGGRSGGGGGGRRHGSHHAGTLLYDAVYLASNELMQKQQGRKAVIVLSDGVDRGSKESLESAIESAQRADTIIYSVLFKDDEEHGNRGGFGFPGMGGGGMGGGRRGGGQRPPEQEERPDGKKILARISKETGGRLFEVSKKQPIEQIYSSIQEELRNQYSLGFTPEKSDTAGYHKLLLKTKQKDATVQTRDGFYAGP
jgi:VWFA-related protein